MSYLKVRLGLPRPSQASLARSRGAQVPAGSLSGDTWGAGSQGPERCHGAGDAVMATLPPVQPGGQVRCGCEPQDLGGCWGSGAAIPPRVRRRGRGAFLRCTKARVGLWPGLPGPALVAPRDPRCPHAGLSGRARPKAGLRCRARHPRDAEPIRAPRWRCRPGSARRPSAGELRTGKRCRGSPRSLRRAPWGSRASAARTLPSSSGWAAGWGCGGSAPARRDGGEPGGLAWWRSPRGSRRCRRCPGAPRPDREHRRGAAAAGGGAGPGSCSPRCPHGRVAGRAPARLVCGVCSGEMLGGGAGEGILPGSREGAPERPEQGSAHACGRSASFLGAVRVTTITVSAGCRHTRAGRLWRSFLQLCRMFVQQYFRSSLTKSGERRCSVWAGRRLCAGEPCEDVVLGSTQLRRGFLCGDTRSWQQRDTWESRQEWKFISGVNCLYGEGGCEEEGKSWKLGK